MNEHVRSIEASEAGPKIDLHIIKLSKPLTTHEGDVTVLTMREPTAADFIDLNDMPYETQGQGDKLKANVNHAAAVKWLVRLTGVDEILLRKLSRRDWLTASFQLAQLLVDEGDSAGN